MLRKITVNSASSSETPKQNSDIGGKEYSMGEPKRVLCILASMNAGGAETFLMKIYRAIDRENYQIDFCINEKEECFYEKEIRQLGGQIYRIPSKSESFPGFFTGLKKLVADQHYQYVLRITSNGMGLLDLAIAKKAGAERCIARSSNSSDGNGMKSKVLNVMGRVLFSRAVDVKVAPSRLAAEYTFGQRAVQDGKVHELKNGLDLEAFRYEEEWRRSIREEFGIDKKTLVVGHVGRFNEQKNHEFLLDVFIALLKRREDCKLLLVGNGVLEDKIRAKTIANGIEDKVIFAGLRSDVPQLLSAMDLFLFPSFYEGMPNTVIEAQATGLSCVISDTITSEAKILDTLQFASLQESPEEWAEHLMDAKRMDRTEVKEKLKSSGYDIDSCKERFTKLIFGESM